MTDSPDAVVVRANSREPAPPVPDGEIVLAPPPTTGDPARRFRRTVVPDLLLPAAAVAFAAVLLIDPPAPVRVMIGIVLLAVVTAVLAVAALRARLPRRRSPEANRRRQYLQYVARVQTELHQLQHQQRMSLMWRHPDPVDLPRIVLERRRLWDHRPAHPDFAVVRLAVGPQTHAVKLVPPRTQPLEQLDPACAAALRTLLRDRAVVPDLPVAIALPSFARVQLRGDLAAARALGRALLCRLLVFHGPDDVVLGRDCDRDGDPHWRWLDGVPHLGDVAALAAGRPSWGVPGAVTLPLLVRLRDRVGADDGPLAGARAGAVTIEIARGEATPSDEPWHTIVWTTATSVTAQTVAGTVEVGEPDQVDLGLAQRIARRLRGLRLPT